MAVIPGYGDRFAFGDPTAPPPEWRKELTRDEENDEDRELTPEERASLVAGLGFDPRELDTQLSQPGSAYLRLAEQWTGPIVGPHGGKYWVNAKTGAHIYHKPIGSGLIGGAIARGDERISKAVNEATGAFGKVSALGEAIEHELAGGVEHVVSKLPAPVQVLLKRGFNIANAPFNAGRMATEALARRLGASPERAATIGKFTTMANYGAAKAVAYGLHAAHIGGLVGIAGPFVPVVSVGYLAYSAAAHPLAVLKAAHDAVAKVKSMVHLSQKVVQLAQTKGWKKEFVEWACQMPDQDLATACFAAAADQLHGDMKKALEAAKAAYGEASKGATE